MKGVCPSCNEEKRLGIHWVQSSCDYPEYTEEELDMVRGLLMGDGYIRDKPKSRNPYLVVAMINQDFLKWLNGKFGVLTQGVSVKSTSQQVSDRAEKQQFGNGGSGTYNDIYQLRFRSHPALNEFTGWYGKDGKEFPQDLELTSDLMRMWYVCDGGLKHGNYPRVMFYSKNELERIDHWVQKVEDLGFECHAHKEGFYIPHSDTRRFLEWMGESPQGFQYKWEVDDRDCYDGLKQEVYSQ